MKITFSSLKCGLLAIYMITLSKSDPFRSPGSIAAAMISLVLAILCLLIPFDYSREIDRGETDDEGSEPSK